MMRKDLPRSKGDQIYQYFNVDNLLLLAAKVTFVKLDANVYFISIDMLKIRSCTNEISTNEI